MKLNRVIYINLDKLKQRKAHRKMIDTTLKKKNKENIDKQLNKKQKEHFST